MFEKINYNILIFKCMFISKHLDFNVLVNNYIHIYVYTS